jgi:hypothetical protein
MMKLSHNLNLEENEPWMIPQLAKERKEPVRMQALS